METVDITIERRDLRGKGAARRSRRQGAIPAILYGPKRSTTAIGISAEEFDRKLARVEGSHLIRLLHKDGSDAELHDRMVLLRDVQRHPVTGGVLHADFYEVDLTKRVAVAVPLHFVGKAAGVVLGGILQPIVREIEAECLPTEIPDFIEIDVSALGIHEAIHVSDLQLPAGVTCLADATQALVSVLPPTVEEKKPEVAPVEGAVPAGAPAPEAEAAAAPKAPPKKGGGEE